MKNNKVIVLFDGICNLCNGAVQLIMKLDKNDSFRFASLQSEKAIPYLKNCNINSESLTSIVVVDDKKCFSESDAVLRITYKLGRVYKLLIILKIIPKRLRDSIYKFIARNRYSWFGKKDSCPLPDEKTIKKFL